MRYLFPVVSRASIIWQPLNHLLFTADCYIPCTYYRCSLLFGLKASNYDLVGRQDCKEMLLVIMQYNVPNMCCTVLSDNNCTKALEKKNCWVLNVSIERSTRFTDDLCVQYTQLGAVM